jgi:hypothetical protein
MGKPLFRRFRNRRLHLLPRIAPGSQSLRPVLHRWRRAKIGPGVFIGDDVHIDGEYPELVEIERDACVSRRVVIERDSFIGPGTVIYCTGGAVLRIGASAVVAGGSVITRSVSARTMAAPPPTRPVAHVKHPFTLRTSRRDFVAGLSPLHRPKPK